MMKKLQLNSIGLMLVILTSLSTQSKAQYEVQQKLVGDREQRAEFGTSTSMNSQYLAVGASRENIATGAVYVYQKNQNETWEFHQKIQAEDGHEMAEFGGAMKMGDNFLAIASGRADIGDALRAGAIYLYDLTDGSFVFNSKLVASDYSDDSLLGANPTCIDISGNTLVAGAPGTNDWAGAVYVFQKINENWTEVQKVTAPEPIEYSNFGIGVSISGNTLIVGASGENNGKGAVYVYEKNANGFWEFQQKLESSTPQTNSYFGNSLHIHENQFVVGAYAEGNPGTDYASAYVFQKNGETWEETQRLVGESSSEDSFYGWMTQISENHLWISAPHFFGQEAGKVYHYTKSSEGIWNLAELIQPNESMEEDAFGWSFQAFGETLAVGATRDDFDENQENELMDAGSVFIFYHNNLSNLESQPTEVSVKIYPNPAQDYLFIQSDEPIQSVKVYDSMGKLMFESSKNQIEISQLPKGIYFLKILTKSQNTSTHRIIKH
ncbi:T9SS type A sorting domain-containing protein [Moheibacter stercoris]|uniref:Secretion system C-terminal sorting domain-containing protein n=1 Tax=Moheibacter stercoris TaxID=1628251 RepID=A0ABV2LRQ0_9FLAO